MDGRVPGQEGRRSRERRAESFKSFSIRASLRRGMTKANSKFFTACLSGDGETGLLGYGFIGLGGYGSASFGGAGQYGASQSGGLSGGSCEDPWHLTGRACGEALGGWICVPGRAGAVSIENWVRGGCGGEKFAADNDGEEMFKNLLNYS